MMNQQIKAFIFDLDGVITDTARYHFKAWRRMANELGFDFSEEKNEELKGVGRLESLNKILQWGGITLSEEEKIRLAEQKNQWYLQYIQEVSANDLLPGAREFLLATREAGIKTALGSASKNAIPIVEKLGVKHLFDVLIDGNKATKSKPDPEVFLLGASELNVDPLSCIVFEDSLAGIQAAKGAGMYTVGIGYMLPKGIADFQAGSLEFLTPSIVISEVLNK
ncbi:beta-phosphoglucomutase [Schleiferia thermophila]|jgi:beta-phosphoglucomutase|uniref:Beta-phosphoglucomutase n=2 Tax=Schleiferia thermophila TaxID=884107 RepID=A0A368ZYR2_9FLAO|nr:beta-phosphoglucomutase [Schleiferia thermophila]RCX02049.1 beta-phosphoglucomutase [Schleiferia thermophila]GCD80573.1 beta-phosphoglucomutase [Schleiferia thermophila]